MVTPYLTQHSPPALVAMLPPMLQISNDDGSGGYHSPYSATAFLTSALSRPGCATAVRVAGSTVMSRIRSVDSTTPPSSAVAPPDSPVPAPRGHHRDTVGGGPAQHRLHLLGAPRPHHGQRGARVRVGGTVLAVGRDDVGIGDDGALG